MSRSGNVWGQRGDGEFFSSRKTEQTARKMYRTRDGARADVFDYIGRFYNPTRRQHSERINNVFEPPERSADYGAPGHRRTNGLVEYCLQSGGRKKHPLLQYDS